MDPQAQRAQETPSPANHQVHSSDTSGSGTGGLKDTDSSKQSASKKRSNQSKIPSNMVVVDRPWPRGKEAQNARLDPFSRRVDASTPDSLSRWYCAKMNDQPYHAIGEVKRPLGNTGEMQTSGENGEIWPYEARLGVTWSGRAVYGDAKTRLNNEKRESGN
ncbi:hypothetical protein CORC01_02540 [Colletotrichum orchidophilum]|uniref:Uncharacterized protein n=1 Tax=Colletotrichum orchidophilum TaxID=1209926 RepID=A0A1G4BLA8_9PEZI|nr:uncharacterized protein CORC01_02540 [Colletotrichum orchidophilum]OHF02260.1 hypothetical protein CORC01_02540 [Colletotrichum orchidophilum]